MPDINYRQITHEGTTIELNGSEVELWIGDTMWIGECNQERMSLEEREHMIKKAKGDVILTGLGLLIIPKHLLKNKEVTSITVLENNQPLIDIMNELNPAIMQQINVICTDANTYKGKCDTLLIDHGSSI